MIDTHVHLWRIGENDCTWPGPDLPAIHRHFLLSDLITVLDEAGVDQAILVQSQPSEADSLWLLDLARDDDRIAGVVGWTDLHSPDAAARIGRLATAGPLVGMRPMAQDGPADAYDDPAMQAGLAYLAQGNLVLDALVRPQHLASLLRQAQRFPNLRIVIDHAAKPAIGGEIPADWLHAMEHLARHQNVACKVSGLLTETIPGAKHCHALPVIDRLLDLFGPDRLIWGSDWPVMMLAAPYIEWRDLIWNHIAEDARQAVFHDNARRIYGVNP